MSATVANPASAPARTWRSGVFAGYGPAGDLAFAAWRGSAIQTATDYIGADDWAQIEDPAWTIWAWSLAPQVQVDLSVALWPASGGSLAQAAAGAYDSHFGALAAHLVAGGLGDAIIRLGWEFNGTWYRWSVHTPAQAAQFAQAWRQIVAAMRSVPGAHFSFDWCPTQSYGGIDPALAYPGDAYVSDIGMDVYDWGRTAGQTPAQRFNALVNDGYGLAWQARFAAEHRKPIAFPEWGLVSSSANPTTAGGDDPLFVAGMYDWFASHDTAFEDYFNSDSANLLDALTGGVDVFPRAAALYQSLYAR